MHCVSTRLTVNPLTCCRLHAVRRLSICQGEAKVKTVHMFTGGWTNKTGPRGLSMIALHVKKQSVMPWESPCPSVTHRPSFGNSLSHSCVSEQQPEELDGLAVNWILGKFSLTFCLSKLCYIFIGQKWWRWSVCKRCSNRICYKKSIYYTALYFILIAQLHHLLVSYFLIFSIISSSYISVCSSR